MAWLNLKATSWKSMSSIAENPREKNRGASRLETADRPFPHFLKLFGPLLF
jgi:hypothetical protein